MPIAGMGSSLRGGVENCEKVVFSNEGVGGLSGIFPREANFELLDSGK
jgi:hypothetical protein